MSKIQKRVFITVMLFVLVIGLTACSNDQSNRDDLYQTALLQSLTLGEYTGSITIKEMKEHGDIGIGTFDELNGELILLDGVVYQALSDGSITIPDDDVTIPFSDVTYFDCDEEKELLEVSDVEDLKSQLTGIVERQGRNSFYMAKITGTFDTMRVRSECSQKEPYRPLNEVMETDQTVFDYQSIAGTVVALYCPDYMNGLNVSGWHFHFLSEDKKKGGHILDLSAKNLKAGLDETNGFYMKLPEAESFQRLELSTDLEDAIKQVETNAQRETDSESEEDMEDDPKVSEESSEQSVDIEKESSEPISTNGLQVIGSRICDADGKPFQLRGISTHGIQWFPEYVNQQLFTQMHDEWNCNVVRITNYTEEYDGYCAGGDQEKLNHLIEDAVTYASNAGLYVILDWHILSDGDPRIHEQEAISFFDMFSKKYADNPYVLYEICNEPNGNGGDWSSIKEYADAVIPVIRNNSPQSLIIVGTPNFSSTPTEPLNNPLPYQNLVYAYHFYAASHRDDRLEEFKRACEQGVPLLVSEFGTVDYSGNGAPDDAMADKWISVLDQYGVGYICWNLSNKDETSALINADCKKTNGFEQKDLKQEGQWLLRTLSKY